MTAGRRRAGQGAPALALNRGLEIAGKAQETYETVAARGEKLVKRVRTQKSTKDLVAQAETTVALGKGAVTTARKAATDIQRSAKATLTTGRQRGRRVADVVADSVADETAEVAATEVETSATAPARAAKRTATTTKKSAASEPRRPTKARHHQRQEDRPATKKATKAAAAKVGD